MTTMTFSHSVPTAENPCGECGTSTPRRYKPAANVGDVPGGFAYAFACDADHAEVVQMRRERRFRQSWEPVR